MFVTMTDLSHVDRPAVSILCKGLLVNRDRIRVSGVREVAPAGKAYTGKGCAAEQAFADQFTRMLTQQDDQDLVFSSSDWQLLAI